ncbi:IS110-like element ISWpi13 family transposase [Wolbachia endosymbiont of Cylisticus convexus]|uniref:hypothetical protein n=1 Tax=Wolbachia endosymbiont of Cylisticus convexus TaxID=118728 RepID=UPI000E1417A7|nr:hypothetical protein [Wolbachia endosymbiont of Cylisticus convexus]RDD33894.1 IS110-like element ISWpi13 family transposase [Wolbachia endosymbiont of Cylisticus convexus]
MWVIVRFQILESYRFEVKLVNARHVKNVPGRKSDVQDCQWLQQYTYDNVANNLKLEKSISRKLLCPKVRAPFIYDANDELIISFNVVD